MASAAGIYEAMWRPGERTAGDFIDRLENGIALLIDNPRTYRGFDPENGWGTYEDLLDFAHSFLDACIRHPKAKVRAST
jgi:hypothetical protein